jgi:hypothetical protein
VLHRVRAHKRRTSSVFRNEGKGSWIRLRRSGDHRSPRAADRSWSPRFRLFSEAASRHRPPGDADASPATATARSTFIDKEDVAKVLPLHDFNPDEPYYLAVFLVGAYQETLGDLHNLLGDTNVVGVQIENGKPVYTHEVEGDTVADVLTYVEFDPKVLVTRFRDFAERAVTEGRITPKERREILDLFREGLSGYTYFES